MTIALALAAVLAACGSSNDSPAAQNPPPPPTTGAALKWPSPSYAQVQQVFTASCLTCHGSPPTTGPMSLAAPDSWARLVNVAAVRSTGTRVVPNDSASSVLHQRLTATGNAVMPPVGSLPAPSIEIVRSWIDEGGARQDLSVSFSGMTPHVGEKAQVRLQSDSGELRTKIVLDPIHADGFDVFVPRAMPPGSHVLDVWVDHDKNGAYGAPPADHAWRRSVPSTGAVTFAHDTSFTDVGAAAASEPGLPFTMTFTGMGPHAGEPLTVAVFQKKTAPNDAVLVGLYRLDAIPADAGTTPFSLAIPGIVQASENYWVDLYADHNKDGAYQAPPTDHAWRVSQSSDANGLSVSFTHNTSFTDVSKYPTF
jgi:hypothetical protein